MTPFIVLFTICKKWIHKRCSGVRREAYTKQYIIHLQKLESTSHNWYDGWR